MRPIAPQFTVEYIQLDIFRREQMWLQIRTAGNSIKRPHWLPEQKPTSILHKHKRRDIYTDSKMTALFYCRFSVHPTPYAALATQSIYKSIVNMAFKN